MSNNSEIIFPRKSKNTARTVEKVILVRKHEEAGTIEIGYMQEILTRCHMPMTNPNKKDIRIYERRDGDKLVRYMADPDNAEGIMYGNDFDVLLRLMTRARQQLKDPDCKRPEIITFSSTAMMLRYFDFPTNGRGYKDALRAVTRLQGTTIKVLRQVDTRGKAYKELSQKGSYIDGAALWVNLNHHQLGINGCENTIVMSPEAMAMLKDAKGLEAEKLLVCHKTVGAKQLFVLLRNRCAAADLQEKAENLPPSMWPHKAYTFIPLHGPNSLETQLGWLEPQPERKVRQQVKQWLAVLRSTVWPNCPAELVRGADERWRLKIWYCPPPKK